MIHLFWLHFGVQQMSMSNYHWIYSCWLCAVQTTRQFPSQWGNLILDLIQLFELSKLGIQSKSFNFFYFHGMNNVSTVAVICLHVLLCFVLFVFEFHFVWIAINVSLIPLELNWNVIAHCGVQILFLFSFHLSRHLLCTQAENNVSDGVTSIEMCWCEYLNI